MGMIRFILFIFLWFIDGVGIFMIWNIESTPFVILYLTWFWLGFLGVFVFNKKALSFYSSRIKWIKD